MPDGRDNRTCSPASAVERVRTWLSTIGAVRTLTASELGRYSAHDIEHGWEVAVDASAGVDRLLVLLPAGFPFARPRIALASEHPLLQMPHFEEHGLACLKMEAVDATKPADMVADALADTCELIEACRNGALDDDFRDEFLSYWHRHKIQKGRSIRSLLRTGGSTRPISVWAGKVFDVVADSSQEITQWLTHLGGDERRGADRFRTGLLVSLPRPPAPREFPRTVGALQDYLQREVPGAWGQVLVLAESESTICIVLEVSTSSGPGFGAVSISGRKSTSTKGFRPGRAPGKLRGAQLISGATLVLQRVERVDAAWVHGRGLNPQQAILGEKTVCVVGCGALGSPVVVRLAQAGVGRLLLIDPQLLESANVGRHALGMDSMGRGKAARLAAELRQRFPHLRGVDVIPKSWAALTTQERERVAQADLIVGTTGEWGGDGALNAWHQARGAMPPVVYGWLEEHGAAAHAVAFVRPIGCLQCLLTNSGRLRAPETSWAEQETLRPEPACGVMFQPFGPVELGYADAMTTELCTKVLLGEVSENTHMVYATETARLTSLGGSWSGLHGQIRPAGFDGQFVTRRAFEARPDCPVCSGG